MGSMTTFLEFPPFFFIRIHNKYCPVRSDDKVKKEIEINAIAFAVTQTGVPSQSIKFVLRLLNIHLKRFSPTQ